MTGSGNKTYHTFVYGECSRCGRNERACNNVIGCDGHAWEHISATYGSAGNTLREEMYWCPNCGTERIISRGRRGKWINHGGKCEPKDWTTVGGQRTNGPKNPSPLKGAAQLK